MSKISSDALADQLADAFGASALAAGAGASMLMLGNGVAIAAGAAAAGFAAGLLVMRRVQEDERYTLPTFAPQPVEPVVEEALLLEDAIGEPEPDSRVVRLFAPGQLQERIDRHLGARAAGDEGWDGGEADAADALHSALEDIRRSLRRR